jgi:hypothetical protein
MQRNWEIVKCKLHVSDATDYFSSHSFAIRYVMSFALELCSRALNNLNHQRQPSVQISSALAVIPLLSVRFLVLRNAGCIIL